MRKNVQSESPVFFFLFLIFTVQSAREVLCVVEVV